MSRKPTRVYVGRNTVQQVKPFLMRREEVRIIAVDFRAMCGLKGITLSSAVWDTEYTQIELGAGTSTGNIAQTTITASRIGPYWGTVVATFSDGAKIKRTWAVLVEQGFGDTGSGGGDDDDPWGSGEPPKEEYLGEVEFEYPLYEIVGTALTVDVTVIRHAGPDGPASVDYTTTNGSLIAGVDYVAKSGTLTWDALDVSNRILPMELLDDNAIGYFNVVLSNPIGVLIGDIGTTVVDVPGGGEISFVEEFYTVSDSEPVVTVEIQRLNGTRGDASSDYATEDGTAVAPSDYTETTGNVAWLNGESGAIPVQIPIAPLAELFERATDYLPDWGQETDDPRVDERPYDYRYGSTVYASEADAVAAAEASIGYELAKLPIWRRRRNGEAPSEPSPLETIDPGEDEFLYFQYVDAESASYLDTALMYSGADWTAAGGGASPEPFVGIAGLSIPLNTYFYLNIYSGVIGYLNSEGDPETQPAPTTGVNGWVAGNNCVEPTCPLSPTGIGGNPGVAQLLIRGMTDIGVRRLTAAPPLPGSDLPDWPIAPDNFWWDPNTGQVYSKQPWSQVSGSYKWLSKYSVTGGGLSTVQRKPLGPVLPVGDPNDTEAFWTAAYNAAVIAGTLPSGMTYDATGTASSLTRYPKNATYAYERSYALPLAFTVGLSNAFGAEIVEPEEATVYIIPA